MSKTKLNIESKISDFLRDTNWVANHTNEIERAINSALDDINAGVIGDRKQVEVGYEFQREIQDVLFTKDFTGTVTTAGTTTLTDLSATFETKDVAVGDIVENTDDGSVARVISVDSETQLTTSILRNGTLNVWTLADDYKVLGKGYEIPSSWNYKFPYYLTVAQDRDIEFIYQDSAYFNKKKNVLGSSEYMYTIKSIGNTEVIQINYATTEDLHFEFFSNNIAKNSSGTRATSMSDDSDELLIPDRYFLIPVELATADCYGQIKGYSHPEHIKFLQSGRQRLSQMVQSIGTIRKKPRMGLRVRGEWGASSSYRFRENN